MKTIAIRREVKELLGEFAEESESMNDAVSRLLENGVELDMSDNYDKTNIWISDESYEQMKRLRLNTNESNNSVLSRLLYAEMVKK